MRWKQFFTPVSSLGSNEVRSLLEKKDSEVQLVDVRQPSEYRNSHLPGAILMPLPKLNDSLDELDRDKPVVVYWAIGGRSRVAAQQLAGAGFKEVINLKGGIKGWDGIEAVGDEEQGLEIFTDLGSAEAVLKTAYSLEEGLQDFYRKTMEKVDSGEARELFAKLADIEDVHKDKIYAEYNRLTGTSDRTAFVRELEENYVEGGMSTEEYLQRFSADLSRQEDIVSLAMSIEAQALDLYSRSARRSEDPTAKEVLEHIASEERYHLERLGDLMDSLAEDDNG